MVQESIKSKNLSSRNNLILATQYGLDAIDRFSPHSRLAIGHHSTHRKNKRTGNYRRLSLSNNPFLYAIYDTTAPRVVIMKAVQVLQTETFLIKKVLVPCSEGRNVLYMLPSLSIARLFVRERVDKLLGRTPFYRHLVTSSETQISNTIMKTFGSGTAMFVGASQETYVEGFPMDVLIYDEYDTLIRQNGEDIVAQAEDREKGADAPDVTKLGNPYAADVMIDGEYHLGDQRVWMVKCHRCNHWQQLNWFTGFVRKVDRITYESVVDHATIPEHEDIPYVCEQCSGTMDRLTPMAEWVAKEPGRDVESYQISRMMVSLPGRTIIREMEREFFGQAVKNPKKMQAFYRSNLGIGYEAGDTDSITTDLVYSCIDSYAATTSSRAVCLVGGDIKTQWWHFMVGRLENDYSITVLYLGKEVDTVKFKKTAFGAFAVRLALLDAQGMGGRIIREQLSNDERLYPLLWSAFYKRAERVFRSKRVLHCTRDLLLDDIFNALRNGDVRFPESARHNKEFIAHMTSNVKIPVVQTIDGSVETTSYTWKKRSGRNDDYLHALGYLLRARDLLIEIHGMLPPSHEHVDGDIITDVSLAQT